MRSRLNFQWPGQQAHAGISLRPPLPANDIITAAGAWTNSSEGDHAQRRHVAERNGGCLSDSFRAISSQLGGRLETLVWNNQNFALIRGWRSWLDGFGTERRGARDGGATDRNAISTITLCF